MDEVDGRIVASFFRDPLVGMGELCHAAGLTPNAVKARLGKLAETDVLRGFNAMPNARLFEATDLVAVYAKPEDTNPPLGQVLDIDPVVELTINHDGKLAAILRLADPQGGPPAALDRLMGGPPERTFVREAPELNPSGTALSPARWRVIEAMLDRPRQATGELARATGLSAKVVRRLRDELVTGGHVTIQPILLHGQATGATFFEVYAQGPAAREPATIQQVLDAPSWVLDRLETPRGVLLLSMAQGLGQAVAARNAIAGADGVEHAELLLAQEHAWAHERVLTMCKTRRKQAELLREQMRR